MECNDFKKSASVAGTAREYPPAVKGGAPMAGHRDSTCEVAVMDNYTTTCLDLEDRTSLYRVAALAQELWLIYREIMWIHFDIERIEKSDNGLSMFGTQSMDPLWPVRHHGFPSGMLDNQQDREAVLSYMGCINAEYWMIEFIDGLLGDIVIKTEEIQMTTKNKREVGLFPASESIPANPYKGAPHHILKVTVRSGGEYAVDLSAAQHGYHDPIMLWMQFKHERLDKLIHICAAPKSHKALQIECYSPTGIIEFEKLFLDQFDLQKLGLLSFISYSSLHILKWQEGEGMSITKLLRLPEKDFIAKLRALVDFVDFSHCKCLTTVYATDNGKRLHDKQGGSWKFGK